jgi:hypothetical protein
MAIPLGLGYLVAKNKFNEQKYCYFAILLDLIFTNVNTQTEI